MEDQIHAATVEMLTARAALLRLLPELAFGAGSGRHPAQALVRLLTPPDWITGAGRISAELGVLIRAAEPIIAAGSWSIWDEGGQLIDTRKTDEASLWSAALSHAWQLEGAMGRLAILRAAQRMTAED